MVDIERSDGRLDPDKLARLVFARFDPWAAAVSVGVVCGALLSAATAACLLRGDPDAVAAMELLAHYLPGYRVSRAGTVTAFIDGGAVGFLFGLSAALLNNVCLRIARAAIRTSAELKGIPQWP